MAYSCRANYCHIFLVSSLNHASGKLFWDSFGDDCNCSYLWIVQSLHSALVSRTEGRKANENVSIRMLFHSIGHVFVDWNQYFLVAPVKLLLVITTKIIEIILSSKNSQNFNRICKLVKKKEAYVKG
jgi:hypothetical protein